MSNQPPNQTKDLRTALEEASRKLAAALDNLQSLTVETRWVEINKNTVVNEEGQLVAKTKIDLDGDTTVTIPMRNENGMLVPDQVLLEMHKEAVAGAQEYRQMLINMITDFVSQVRR